MVVVVAGYFGVDVSARFQVDYNSNGNSSIAWVAKKALINSFQYHINAAAGF